MRQEKEYFEAVRDSLKSLDGVGDVKINATTGSMVILHPETAFSDIEPELNALQLFEIMRVEDAGPEALNPAQLHLANADRAIARWTKGMLDLRLLTVAGAVGFSIRQYKRGKLLGPAVALVWTAADLVVHLVPPKSRAE